MQACSKIAVNNMGGYVFNFTVQWLDPSTGDWVTVKWNSGNYPIDQSQTSPELGTLGVASGAIVTPYGHAVLGTSGQGKPFCTYTPGAATASYNAKGTTYVGFEIVLVQ